jgi:O-antigen ligase
MPDLNKIKFILVLITIASLPFSESIKTISMYLAFLVMLVQFYRKDIRLGLTLMHWGFLLLIVSALACSLFADNPMKSLRGIRDILLYSTVFFVVCSISNEKHARAILWAFYISTAAAAMLGISHLIREGGMIEISQLRNHNYIAMYLVIAFSSMVSTIIFSDKETWRTRLIIGIFMIPVLVAAVFTAYRSSFIGVILFVGAFAFAGGRTKRLLPYAAGMMCIILLAIFMHKPMWDKLMSTKSFFARLALWEYSIDLFKADPITGAGLDHYKGLIPAGVPDAGKTFYDAHSLYFNVAAQMGLLGLLSLALIIFGFIREFCKTKELPGFGMSLKYGALGGFLVTFAGGLFDTTLNHGHAVAFALLAGLFVAHGSQVEDKFAAPDKTGEGEEKLAASS